MNFGGFRKLVAIAGAIALVATGAVPAAAVGSSPSLLPVTSSEAMVYLAEEDTENEWGSKLYLQPDAPDADLKRDPWIECPTIDHQLCDFAKPGYSPLAWLSMPLCESAVAEDCIDSVRFRLGTQNLPVEYFGLVPGQQVFPADARTQLHRGGISPLFRVPGAPHSGGDLYMISSQATSNYNPETKRFVANDLNLFVIPVSIEDPSYAETYSNSVPCLWLTETSCGVRREFSSDIRISVQLRVTKQFGGWFLGRMQSPDIEVQSFSEQNNRITVEAAPVEVARFAYTAPKSEFSMDDLRATGNSGGMEPLTVETPIRIYNVGYDTSNFGFLNHFRDRVKDTAVGTSTHWSLRTTSRDASNPCLVDKARVLGIVSTNAMVFDGFSPTFVDGFLGYQVAGLHLMPDGKTPITGTYDLVMRSETARCLYGFTNAPVSAAITITGTGNLNIATTKVSEKDGWLKLAASGFTFSKKQIRVALSQPKIANPTTVNLPKFKGKTTQLTLQQKWAIEDFAKASGSTKTLSCTSLYVNQSDRNRAAIRARAACNAAKFWNRDFTVRTSVKQTKSKALDGRVVLVSR